MQNPAAVGDDLLEKAPSWILEKFEFTEACLKCFRYVLQFKITNKGVNRESKKPIQNTTDDITRIIFVASQNGLLCE